MPAKPTLGRLLLAIAILTRTTSGVSTSPPNLIFVLVDDWGFANFGLHRAERNVSSREVATPNADRQADSGVRLERHYSFMYCSPSRCALQTGRNPLHVNVLNSAIGQHNGDGGPSGAGVQGAARDFTGLGERMRSAGYWTAAIGKWNSGMAFVEQAPAGRGYDTSLTYFDYMTDQWSGVRKGQGCTSPIPKHSLISDLWESAGPAVNENNTWNCSQFDQSAASCPHGYQDSLFLSRVEEVVLNASRTPETPLFLFWAPHAPHDPYECPNAKLANFSFIDDVIERQFYSAMVSLLDDSLGALENALRAGGLYENSYIFVVADNGGPVTGGVEDGVAVGYGGSNFPLRGGKESNLEGGIRTNAFVFGGLVDPQVVGTVSNELVEIADWHVTLCTLAGANNCTNDARAAASGLPPVDGLDVSGLFVAGGNRTSPRDEIVLGASDGADISSGNTIAQGLLRRDGYKLILGNTTPAFWQGPVFPNASGWPNVTLNCGEGGCLFNVFSDETEHVDLAAALPEIAAEMRARIALHAARVFNPDRGQDDGAACAAAFARHNGFYGPFLGLG